MVKEDEAGIKTKQNKKGNGNRRNSAFILTIDPFSMTLYLCNLQIRTRFTK